MGTVIFWDLPVTYIMNPKLVGVAEEAEKTMISLSRKIVRVLVKWRNMPISIYYGHNLLKAKNKAHKFPRKSWPKKLAPHI